MSDITPPEVTDFASEAAATIPLLQACRSTLEHLRVHVDDPVDEFELLNAQLLTLLVEHRGRRLSPECNTNDSDSADGVWYRQLVACRERLIAATTGTTSFEGLQFLNALGELCIELGRHVNRP